MRQSLTSVPHRNTLGFTLIELMIVVVIIGILAAIAWPQYQDYVVNSRRSTCAARVVELAGHMERHFTENRSYLDGGSEPTVTQFIGSANCPAQDNNPAYTLSITADSDSYTVNAAPQGMQANNGNCGTLSIDETGAKTASGSASASDCW
jgi:type IV pilus assembly protein PilE